MRLLELKDGEFSLTRDIVDNREPYAILSHTWGADDEEVTYKNLTEGSGKTKPGYGKILFCGQQAARDGLRYCWVDTCCIDKSNHAELQEAINSMFRWYHNATKCYVYLSDVSRNHAGQASQFSQSWLAAFRKSRWFTRGWTLQELIAPQSVEFFCSNGSRLGDKTSLEQELHEITGIAVSALQGTTALSAFSVEERMAWADNRQTKREEDKAYSLLGIFDIYMPLIYGERAENAFTRLRDELEKKRLRKRDLDDISTFSQDTANFPKRSRTTQNQSPSASQSQTDQSCPDPKPTGVVNHNIDTTTKQSIIDQLYFTKIDERLTSLTAAQGVTCRWFLTSPEYTSWQDITQRQAHGGFLWIKGHPGTGKSTLMKLIFEEAKLNTKGDPLQITLSFFFLARGTAEEKSTTGLYRSLLHQLFEKAVALEDSLEWMTADGAKGIQRNGWHKEALKRTLTHVVQNLGSRSLTIFIDALDECEINEVADMVCFFEDLCDSAKEARAQLQICFSSRHYPTVAIQKGIEIALEDQNGHIEDIKQYIKSKLRLGKSKQAESLGTEILQKSSGIFLWAVLVLDILNSEFPGGSVSIKKIRKRLEEVPPGLAELFEMILARDGTNLEQLDVCLKWILFATRPIRPQELYFAIQFGLDKNCSGRWDQEDVELEQMKFFVRSSSKGLAEVTRNKASEVQFIHESVRDFLFGKYGGQWSGSSGNFVGHGHETLRDCCMAQLNASISQDIAIPDPLPPASKAARLRETVSLELPFLEYSVRNVLCHADSAQHESMEQADFLASFPLHKWRFLSNLFEKFDIRRYTDSVSLLYILAEKNFVNLIRIHPRRESCFEVENERYGPPIFAAAASGSHQAVQTFLEIQAKCHPEEPLLLELCQEYSGDESLKFGRDFIFYKKRSLFSYLEKRGDNLIVIFLCALHGLDIESKDEAGRTTLSLAAGRGHKAIVKWLVAQKGAEVDSKAKNYRTPLSFAAEYGHEEVVKLLLEKGAEIDSTANNDRTPLSFAVENGHEEVVKLLLDKGADVEAGDFNGRTLLLWATIRGHEMMVKMLLEKDAKLEAKDNFGQTSLLRAVIGGHERVVKLLLEKGAELEAENDKGTTPLLSAAARANVAVVELLLEKGATLEAKDNFGQTSLHRAAQNGYEAIVKKLLEKGAGLEAQDDEGRTPLLLVARLGNEAVVKLLLENGADVEAQDNFGRKSLLIATIQGHKEVVKMLVEKGAELEAKDTYGRTSLVWAAIWGHEELVKLFLENGAELEAQDDNGSNPLISAVGHGHEAVVKLLLAEGAKLDSHNNNGTTPLLLAAESGHEAIIKLLLDKGAEPNGGHGPTALSRAVERGYGEIEKLLREYGAKEDR